MALIFGKRWTSAFEHYTPDDLAEYSRMWADQTETISDATLLRVLDHIQTKWDERGVPTLPSFMRLCTQFWVDAPKPPVLQIATSARSPEGKTVAEYMAEARRVSRDPSGQRLDSMLKTLDQQIAEARARGLIKTHRADQLHLCDYPDCRNAGSLSHATAGGSTWYCSTHFTRG